MSSEYRDFFAYNLENTGEYNELDITEDQLEEYLHPEEVLLVIRQDLRRLFIWKGPKSPVRKRFISSRVAAELQEEIRKDGGRHLKIISVDAGDEPIEFLSAFDLDPMEVGKEDRLQDMRYVRNIDKAKVKEERLRKKLEASKKKKKEYWSPLLEEQKKEEKIESAITEEEPKAKSKVVEKKQSAKKLSKKAPIRKKFTERAAPNSMKLSTQSQSVVISKEDANSVINEILQEKPPDGYKRMNIIIGQSLFTPQISKSVVLGKTVEKEEWTVFKDLPNGKVDVDLSKLRLCIDEASGIIKAIEIYQKSDGSELSEDKQSSSKKETSASKKTKRKLPSIPSGN